MNQPIVDFFQEDLLDFRMSHDKIDSDSSLIMSRNHYHKSYELYYQLYGEKYYFIKDKTYKIQSGDIVLINSYDLHRTSAVNNKPTERILVRINENYTSGLTSSCSEINLFAVFKESIPILRLNTNGSIDLRNHLFKMLEQYHKLKTNKTAINLLLCKVLAVELLLNLNNLYPLNLYNNFEHPSNVHKRISEVVNYINSNYMSQITLSSIADLFHFSKFHFARLFKSVTGLTFVDYLNIIRLKESLNLLLATDFSISRISSDVGYSDSSYYCRVFKKYYNCSPAHYRKEYFKTKGPK